MKLYRIVTLFGKITWQKMETKFGQFKKLKCLKFVNCPNFVTIFCRVLKIKIIFFDIPSNPPHIAVWNSLTNHFFQKNWRFCIFSLKNKKKVQNWRKEKCPGTLLFSSVLHFFWLKIYRIVNLFGKIDLSLNSGPQWAGIARNIKKNYFHFQNATKNGNKVVTIYKVGTFPFFK